MSAPDNSERRALIRQLWKKDVEKIAPKWSVYFIVGRDEDAPPELIGDVLYVHTKDAYENLPRKTFRTIEFFAANQKFDYLFKTDDDCYLNVRELARFRPQDLDYFGHKAGNRGHKPDYHFGRTTGEPVLDTSGYHGSWASGSGYCLSRKGARWVIDNVDFQAVKNLIFEDKMVGDLLRQSGLHNRLKREWSALKLTDFCSFDLDENGYVIESSIEFKEDAFPLRRIVYHLGGAGGAVPLYRVDNQTMTHLAKQIDRILLKHSILAVRVRQFVSRRLRRVFASN